MIEAALGVSMVLVASPEIPDAPTTSDWDLISEVSVTRHSGKFSSAARTVSSRCRRLGLGICGIGTGGKGMPSGDGFSFSRRSNSLFRSDTISSAKRWLRIGSSGESAGWESVGVGWDSEASWLFGFHDLVPGCKLAANREEELIRHIYFVNKDFSKEKSYKIICCESLQVWGSTKMEMNCRKTGSCFAAKGKLWLRSTKQTEDVRTI